MKEFFSVVTREGQVSIPAEVRRALSINEGDTITFEIEAGKVQIVRSETIVSRTAGALGSDMPMLEPEEERSATEQAIADDVFERLRQ